MKTTNSVKNPRSHVEVDYLQSKYREEKDVRLRERIHGVLLYYKGYDPREIGDILGRDPGTIREWIERYKEKRDINALRDKPRSGRPGNLTKDEEKELDEIISNKKPSDFDYDNVVWDMKVVKDFVKNRYGAVFSHSGMWRVVRERLGFSYGKPYQKDARQDAAKVNEFKEETLPKVVKQIESLLKEGKKVLVGFQDESHHQIMPNVHRALFKGKSPSIETLYLRDEKKTAYGFLPLSGDLFVEYYDTGNAENFIDYCKSLEKKHEDYDHIFIFVDNAKYHGNAKYRGSLKVRAYWKESKIEPVFIPPYSPKLNLIEQVWRVIKKHLSKYLFRKINEVTNCVFEFIGQKEHQFSSIVSKFAKKHFSDTLAHHLV